MDHPLLSRNALLTAGGAVGVLWLMAAMLASVVLAVLAGLVTVVAIGGYVWLRRMNARQRRVLDLLQGAQASPEARRAAVESLAAGDQGSKDVLSRIARAQLEMQDDPDRALKTLEGLDLVKVPAVAADEVRVVRAQIYLYKGRLPEARGMADDIQLKNAQTSAARAMMVAMVAEAWARTGKHEAAWDLLTPVDPHAADLAQVKWPLLFARVFAAYHCGKKERCRKDLEALMGDDVNLLGRFVMPGQKVHPELMKLAQAVVQTHPDVKRMAKQAQRQGMRYR
ncbi:MAG: hypothetical protein EXR79_16605 [Myxococcales bacterium]|nr:hypothetical protein [Myxococcales bacterium]